ncbi:MAG: helix-turn-helix transcriptional regulator [Oscillospiraceae bacterium]|nr:helix-turn-helix transcriptional regulator [Oscillospiraceae bacterium]
MDNRAGRLLRDRRLELGLTQEDMALELGMSIHQYQRYEYGDRKLMNSPMRIGLRICEVLELDPYEVVFEMKTKRNG